MAIRNNPAMNSQAKTNSSKMAALLNALLNCFVELEKIIDDNENPS
jgi:hypothetical protein